MGAILRAERLAADPVDVEATPRAHDGARVWKPDCLRKQQDRLQRLGLGMIVLRVARLDINVHPDRLQGQRSGTRLGSARFTVQVGLVVPLHRRAEEHVLETLGALQPPLHVPDEVQDVLIGLAALQDVGLRHGRAVLVRKGPVQVDPAGVTCGRRPRHNCAHEGRYGIPVSRWLIRQQGSYTSVQIGIGVSPVSPPCHVGAACWTAAGVPSSSPKPVSTVSRGVAGAGFTVAVTLCFQVQPRREDYENVDMVTENRSVGGSIPPLGTKPMLSG